MSVGDEIPKGFGLLDYTAEYWQKKYWKAVYNYGEANRQKDTLGRDNKQLTELNRKQAAKIMQLELLLSCVHRVGSTVFIQHDVLQRTTWLLPDTQQYIKLNSKYRKPNE